jgi:hypothetical protein
LCGVRNSLEKDVEGDRSLQALPLPLSSMIKKPWEEQSLLFRDSSVLIKHIFFEPSCHCNLKVSVSELYLNSL